MVYNYDVGILIPSKGKNKYDNVVQLEDRYYIKLGTTYNTSIDVDKGDILELYVASIKQSKDDEGKIKYTFDNPTVHSKKSSSTSLTTVQQLKQIMRAGRGYFHKFAKVQDKPKLWLSTICKLIEETQEYIKAKKPEGEGGGTARTAEGTRDQFGAVEGKKFKFVLQHHMRGLSEQEAKTGKYVHSASVHSDIRFLQSGADNLIGITAASPANTKQQSKILNPDGHVLVPGFKKHQPKAWISVGRDKPLITEPGEVGATSKKWARFEAMDWGTGHFGKVDEHYIEICFNGKKVQGRWILTGYPTKRGRVWNLSKPDKQEMEVGEC